MRTLLLIATVWLLYVVIRQSLKRAKNKQTKSSDNTEKNQDKIASATIKCEHCGVYIPKRESIRNADHYYCSEQHARLGNNDKPN